MNEARIQKQIQVYIHKIGGYCFKVHGDIFMRAGIPDIIACIQGRFVGIEVKDIGNEPSALQLAHGRMIVKSGGLFCVAYNVEEVQKFLRDNNFENV